MSAAVDTGWSDTGKERIVEEGERRWTRSASRGIDEGRVSME
jgi:hypothetical protein